jgi:serine/threonine protein kinase
LPREFAFEPDRLVGFKHEGQVLASLNHPNITAIYGFEDSEGIQALVLELCEGPTLADAGRQHADRRSGAINLINDDSVNREGFTRSYRRILDALNQILDITFPAFNNHARHPRGTDGSATSPTCRNTAI